MHLVKIWLIFLLAVPNAFGSEDRALAAFKKLDNEARQAARAETLVLMRRLSQMIQLEKPAFRLNPEIFGLATEIFFQFSLSMELNLRMAELVQIKEAHPPLKRHPRIIVVNSRPGIGNTTVLQLISKILAKDPGQIEHVFLGNEQLAQPDELVRRFLGKKIVILDNFSQYYDQGNSDFGHYLLPWLEARAEAEFIFVIVDAETTQQLDAASRARIKTVFGHGNKLSACDQFLSKLLSDEH